jgi:hypothetical protein
MIHDQDEYVLERLQNGFTLVSNHAQYPPTTLHPYKMSFQSKFVQMVLAEVDAAIMKAATPAETVLEFATAEEARDAFRKMVLEDLAERFGSSIAMVTVPVASAASPTEKKKRGPMSDEKKAIMKAKREATVAAKKASAPGSPASDAVPLPASPVASTADSPKEKKKRAPMSDEAKAAMKAKRDATLAAKASSVNLLKIDPTWRKHLKTAAKAQKVEVTKEMEASLLGYLNSVTKDAFNAKKAEEHVVAFLAAPAPAAVEDKQPANLEIVEFEGKDYYVNADTKRVYVGEGEYDDESGGWTNYKAVGYVGMAAFAEMTLE